MKRPESSAAKSSPTVPARLFTAPIRLYSRAVSPALPRRCKYEPTCSSYAVEAVERFGVVRGLLLAAWRLLRCNPFSHGGFDPVRERFTLRVGPMDPAVYHGEVPPDTGSQSSTCGHDHRVPEPEASR